MAYPLGGGNLLVIFPNGTVRVVDFDVAAFLHHAGLIIDFKSKLPNQDAIDAALAEFLALEDRGFIRHNPLDNTIFFDGFPFRVYVSQIEKIEQIRGDLAPPVQQNPRSTNSCYHPCRPYCSKGT